MRTISILSIVYLFFCLPLNAQTISNCTAPTTLITNYETDVKDLAIKRIISLKNSDTSEITIPTSYQDTIWSGMAAIFNLNTSIARDSVFNIYCIHNSSPNNSKINYSINVGVNTSFSWTSAWASSTTTTGFTALDNILSRHGFTLNSYSSSLQFASLSTTKTINIDALCDSLELLANGITYAEPNSSFGDGHRIDFDKIGDTLFYNFSLGWSDCNSGCIDRHTWKFRVNYSTCNVKFLGIHNRYGNSIPSYITPLNCALTSINNFNKDTEVKLFPNPATNQLHIELNNSVINNNKIKVIDITGKTVLSENIESQNSSIDISSLKKGVYLILVESTSGYNYKPMRFIKI